jgi:ferredoxin
MRLMDTPRDYLCRNCYRCIQECPTRSLTKTINPEYRRLGNEYWTPEIVASIWSQAETGKIPVLGAGYRGPFSGPGFDAMWTDMSEIVRPTRDGIHGREYIHTGIDIGAKPDHLTFNDAGTLVTQLPVNIHIPLPIIFGPIDGRSYGHHISNAIALAARALGIPYFTDPSNPVHLRGAERNLGILRITGNPEDMQPYIPHAAIAEIEYSKRWHSDAHLIKKMNPGIIVAVTLPFQPHVDSIAEKLVTEGTEVIHLMADHHGRAPDIPDSPVLADMLTDVHTHLVAKGLRDRVTILASGGIAAAEHVPKTIIAGADGIILMRPILIAMECLACGECTLPEECPRDLPAINPQWGAARLVNLMGAWHSQLLEVLGAMGIREVRRLRGERGRALFFEELEREVFQELLS